MDETQLRTNIPNGGPFRGDIPAVLQGLVLEYRLARIYEDPKCVLFESPKKGRYLKYVICPATYAPLNRWLQELVLRGLRNQARVSHLPGVQHVFGNGFYAGIPGLFELEFVQGVPLGTFTEADSPHHLEPERILLIGLSTYRTLQSVHEHAVMHRDMKPNNVILEGCIETGIATKTIDWSIAATAEEHEDDARKGMVYGTPAYMKLDNDSFPVRDLSGLGRILLEAAATTDQRYVLIRTGEKRGVDYYLAKNQWEENTLKELKGCIPPELHDMIGGLLNALPSRTIGGVHEIPLAYADTAAVQVTRIDRPKAVRHYDVTVEASSVSN